LRERAGNPTNFVGGGDAVHPGPIGQTIMAWAVLKGLGAEPMVSRAEIDATAKKVTASERCRISELKFLQGAGLSFERLDEALPMPVDTRAEAALKLAPVLEDLDRYELRVSGLTGGSYEVKIDGESAGKVSSGELGRGWNLANAHGPITQQARDVLKLVFEKNDLFFRRWRDIQLFNFPAWAQGAEIETVRMKAIEKADQQIAEREGEIDKLRRPKTHRFELTPAKD